VDGLDIVKDLENTETKPGDKPVVDIVIADCGMMPDGYQP
jgi:hypothetical protein